jgi:hypothetical protein
MSTTIQTDEHAELDELAELIQLHLLTSKTYSFRTVKIDGVWFYPVIHRHRKIVNFECVNIMCRMKNKQGDDFTEKYSAYYTKYKSVKEALTIIKNVAATYKIFNGDLLSPADYKMAKLEENLLPYAEEQVCCVCYENTMDTTICDHYLCMKCREICIHKERNDCPMCRNPGIVNIYNIDNGLINNNAYGSLKEAIEFDLSNSRERSPSVSPFRIYGFIDRVGSRHVRSLSAESAAAEDDGLDILAEIAIQDVASSVSEEDLSTIGEISEHSTHDLEDSQDIIPFNLNV